MKPKLKIFLADVDNYDDLIRRFRFAVLNLDKSQDYPANFVCILPTQFVNNGKTNSQFINIFGDKSQEQAKSLLTEALKNEDNFIIKEEIRRRLSILKSNSNNQIKCSTCGKLFSPRRIRGFKQNLCEKCLKRKNGTRQ